MIKEFSNEFEQEIERLNEKKNIGEEMTYSELYFLQTVEFISNLLIRKVNSIFRR